MAEVTLQSQVNRILLATFVLVAGTSVASIYGYSHLRNAWTKNRISEEISKPLPDQVDALIPSFLLPEQKAGVCLMLDRIKKNENLTSISIVEDDASIAARFPGCSIKDTSSICFGADGYIAAVSPIRESGRLFGYLVKVKQNDPLVAGGNWVEILEIIGAVLFVAFVLLFRVLAKLMSREVPKALGDLLNWIEADLNDDHSVAPYLKFKELRDLRERISIILDRHDHARDQVIIGQLTSGIMHDIKTPLSSIVTATDLASEQPKDSPKRLSRLENLLSVCQARLPVVGAIIESTLDGSRDVHVEKTSNDITGTVKEAIGLSTDFIHVRNAHVSFDIVESRPEVAHDPTQFLRVFSNLIRNGLEAAQGDDEPKLFISIKNDENSTKIAVEDNGPGIPENSDKVFRVFRSTKAHGSGLGLLISRKIVEAHHGKLVVTRSEKLGGARFEVCLPRIQSGQLGAFT